ncbi:PREDICTED: G1/S-specific cyclin-E2 [Myotis davidii]|uniref:G1/S-specific cyclin-E2 n=1 Tax=Myotis davidii TaxID=225400 RepID=UPI000767D5C1|nr:PREDICTED: G1/S-specific cyclin-E2 [Myotis davidii]
MSLQVCTATAHGGTSSPGGRAIASITTARPFLGTDEILGPFWFCLGKTLPPSARVNLGHKHSLCQRHEAVVGHERESGEKDSASPKAQERSSSPGSEARTDRDAQKAREGTPWGEEEGGVPAAASRIHHSSRLQAKQQPQPSQTDSPQEAQIIQAKKRKTAQDVRKRREEKVAQKHQYEIRNCWPPALSGGISPCIIIETPHKEIETSDFSRFTNYRFKNLFINPSPLPDLSWGCSNDVWLNMLKKETRYVHDKHFEVLHSDLEPQMRSILLDWLLEVCEVYTLHRETFYLAQDFFDRFMLTQKDINKNMLQLIGITSLFIASKLEEIYAPKLQEFAYVTDGACSEEDILRMELIILKALKWELCPVTVISWLNLFLQVDALKDAPKVLLPQYSQEKFIQIAQLLDLCILAIDSLEFQYRVLAAAALCHFTSIEVVKKASGLEWESISECVEWMVPFASVVKSTGPVKLKMFNKISMEDRHNIQTHTNYLPMLEEVSYVNTLRNGGQLSPVCNGGLMTPPKSTEKPSGKH